MNSDRIIEILKADYQRFPSNQTYSIYVDDVYFQDPLNKFRGVKRYKKMIAFMSNWFRDIKMVLHDIRRIENIIETDWTLYWTTPLPWQPRIAISGRSELKINREGLIIAHLDYWHCSRFNVLKQHFFPQV
ncbi:MAG: DUF2358 domain-containing protein [Okeania sp. SIO2D1]|nr:DUF2358 domain-containing protein [Okeania sp. SIO2D1]